MKTRPDMTISGRNYHFWSLLAPWDISVGAKRFQPKTLDVKFNVQLRSTIVQPSWESWNLLWPDMAVMAILR